MHSDYYTFFFAFLLFFPELMRTQRDHAAGNENLVSLKIVDDNYISSTRRSTDQETPTD